jgi:hypothetical protein
MSNLDFLNDEFPPQTLMDRTCQAYQPKHYHPLQIFGFKSRKNISTLIYSTTSHKAIPMEHKRKIGYNLSCSEQNQLEKHEAHKEKNGT